MSAGFVPYVAVLRRVETEGAFVERTAHAVYVHVGTYVLAMSSDEADELGRMLLAPKSDQNEEKAP